MASNRVNVRRSREFRACSRASVQLLCVLACLLVLSSTAHLSFAHSYRHGPFMIGHPRAEPTNGREGSVFFAALNTGDEPDQLVEVRTPIAKEVEFWVPQDSPDAAQRGLILRLVDYLRALWNDDDAGLVRVDTISFPPGQPIPMRPGASHLRLLHLARPLAEGDRFDLTLIFKRTGSIAVEVWVEQTPGS